MSKSKRRRNPQTAEIVPFPEPTLHVRALADPVLDALGHDPRSAYVEQYWLSILGPSATLLLRRLAVGLERSPAGYELDPHELSAELGLGSKGGRNSPLWRAIERIGRFGLAQRNGHHLHVRRRMPPLTAGQLIGLAPHLQQAHETWAEQRINQTRRKTISRWSPVRDSLAIPPPIDRANNGA